MSNQLTIEEKREAVYSSLFRFSSDAIPLRERALQRVVLGSLVGSSKKNPFGITDIKENLSVGSVGLSLRTDKIQETLNSLGDRNLVKSSIHQEYQKYFLSEKGKESIQDMTFSSEDLFNKVTSYLFDKTKELIDPKLAAKIFRRFAFNCFARFGRQIANSVTGTISKSDLLGRIDAEGAIEHATKPFDITDDQNETIKHRCLHFLKCSETNCEKLKFYLTQGYYFTQLVGLENARFNPLTEEAFSGSIFYIDTNVLLIGLLDGHEDSSEFQEMIHLANRLDIHLRVTNATINEALTVIENRIPDIKKVIDTIPEELIKKTSDDVLLSYYKKLSSDPGLTADEFFDDYRGIASKLKDWGIEIDEKDSAELIDGRDIELICVVMNQEAEKARGWGKSEKVLKHDVAHYLIVEDERKKNKKCWFLTRDTSFQSVSERLIPDSPSFSFFHIGFLQCISPFVTSDEEELSLADILSGFISDQVTTFESLYDLQELSLMADYHEDVMATPPDQLVMAFDYIKSHTLKGSPYRNNDIPDVSLELKKFLSADKEEQIATLQTEKERILEEKRKEQRQRILAEEKANEKELRREKLEKDIDDLRGTLESLQKELQEQEDRSKIEKQNSRLTHAAIGIIIAWVLLIQNSEFAQKIATQVEVLSAYGNYIEVVLNLLSACIFAIPGIRYINNTNWEKGSKIAGFTMFATIVLGISGIFSDDLLSKLSDIIGVGGTIAILLYAMLNGQFGEK